MPVTLGAASPTVILSMAANPGKPENNANPGQEALTTALDAPAMEEWQLSVPETAMPVTRASNQSQLGASYLNNWAQQVTSYSNIFMCSSNSFAQENLKSLLIKRLNDKIYNTCKNNLSNINFDSIREMLPDVHAYNQEMAKLIQEVNVKYGFLLNYTVLEVSELQH